MSSSNSCFLRSEPTSSLLKIVLTHTWMIQRSKRTKPLLYRRRTERWFSATCHVLVIIWGRKQPVKKNQGSSIKSLLTSYPDCISPTVSSITLLFLSTVSETLADRLMAINGFRLDFPPFISPRSSHPLVLFCFPSSPSTYRNIYLVLSLPAPPHFPPLVHLPDSTGTLGDPGQTRCRGNRQSRKHTYIFIIFFPWTRQKRGLKEDEDHLWAPTDMNDMDEVRLLFASIAGLRMSPNINWGSTG